TPRPRARGRRGESARWGGWRPRSGRGGRRRGQAGIPGRRLPWYQCTTVSESRPLPGHRSMLPLSMRIRWFVLALLFGFAFTGYVQRASVAIAAQGMMPELGLSQTQVGWLFTAFLFTYSVFQIPGALLGQRLGPRWTLTGLGLVTVAASVLTVAAPAWAATGGLFLGLLAARALLGMAQAAVFPLAAGTHRARLPVGAWE